MGFIQKMMKMRKRRWSIKFLVNASEALGVYCIEKELEAKVATFGNECLSKAFVKPQFIIVSK